MNLAVSLSGLRAALDRQDVTANNIANALTPAYKSQRTAQVNVSSGGTRIASLSANFQQGPLEISDGQFHLAVNGDGFFAVEGTDGIRYTRSGQFSFDAKGNVVTPDGRRLSPNIQLPPDAKGVEISAAGDVYAVMGSGDSVKVGQVRLARFNNPNGLVDEGSNLYSSGPASGEAIYGRSGEGAFGNIAFGFLEGSNVDLSTEIVSQIVNRVAAKANISAIRAEDKMMKEVIDITV